MTGVSSQQHFKQVENAQLSPDVCRIDNRSAASDACRPRDREPRLLKWLFSILCPPHLTIRPKIWGVPPFFNQACEKHWKRDAPHPSLFSLAGRRAREPGGFPRTEGTGRCLQQGDHASEVRSRSPDAERPFKKFRFRAPSSCRFCLFPSFVSQRGHGTRRPAAIMPQARAGPAVGWEVWAEFLGVVSTCGPPPSMREVKEHCVDTLGLPSGLLLPPVKG